MDKMSEKLRRLITAVESAKPEKSRLEGELKILMRNITAEFGVKTPKEGLELRAKWHKELEGRKKEVEDRYKKLEGRYKW